MHSGKLTGPILILGSLVLSIAAAEIFLRFFAPVSDPYQAFKDPHRLSQPYIRSWYPPNYRATTEVDLDLPSIGGPKTFSINNMGFRGETLVTPKPQKEFRIFMIGGSTTECHYLGDSEAINMVLQNQLAEHADTSLIIKVYNAGESGDASDDHIAMLVHRIVHLEPDMVIVFSGVNDLLRSMSDYDYLHYRNDGHIVKYLAIKGLATEFQIPRRIYYLLTTVYPTEQEVLERISERSNYKQKIALRKSAPVSDEKPKTNLNAYATNLQTIIGVAMAHQIRLVFMTQQTTWNSTVDPRAKDWHWMLDRAGVAYREDLMDKAMESLNDVMRHLSKINSIPIYDLAKTMPKSLDFFYDDVHFNVKGANIAGKQLASYILRANLIPKYK